MIFKYICHPWIREILQINKFTEMIRSKVATVTGRVPRQLSELTYLIQRTVGGAAVTPNAAIVNEYFSSKPWDPITKLQYFLDLYSQHMERVYAQLHSTFFLEHSPTTQPGFIKMCVDVLTYSTSTFATTQYP